MLFRVRQIPVFIVLFTEGNDWCACGRREQCRVRRIWICHQGIYTQKHEEQEDTEDDNNMGRWAEIIMDTGSIYIDNFVPCIYHFILHNELHFRSLLCKIADGTQPFNFQFHRRGEQSS